MYAKIAGISIAAFGILAYFSAFGFATFAACGYVRLRKFFGLTVCAMFAITLWLLFVQTFILHAFCRYCLFLAAFVVVLAAVVVPTPSSPNRIEQDYKQE
jgi:uncharacterized membrane protein